MQQWNWGLERHGGLEPYAHDGQTPTLAGDPRERGAAVLGKEQGHGIVRREDRNVGDGKVGLRSRSI
jgi:hypothetical protein